MVGRREVLQKHLKLLIFQKMDETRFHAVTNISFSAFRWTNPSLMDALSFNGCLGS